MSILYMQIKSRWITGNSRGSPDVDADRVMESNDVAVVVVVVVVVVVLVLVLVLVVFMLIAYAY